MFFVFKGEVMPWMSSAGPRSLDQQPSSTQIEMASYVLLAFFLQGNFIEGISLVKWLSTQRTHQGGFGTTQVKLVFVFFREKNDVNISI